MREILFRGKTVQGTWVESCSVFIRGELALMLNERPIKEVIKDKNGEPVDVIFSFCSVEKNTVGQFTGLTDKNGKKIFEGDIIQQDNGAIRQVVQFNVYSWQDELDKCYHAGFDCVDKTGASFWISPYDEVIGNINDNPELLEK